MVLEEGRKGKQWNFNVAVLSFTAHQRKAISLTAPLSALCVCLPVFVSDCTEHTGVLCGRCTKCRLMCTLLGTWQHDTVIM